MKPEMRVLVFVVLCHIYVNCAALNGKALYCRDPDSGKLHAVNTTWPSTSFCGNYTCKLRRKNITGTEYTPIRQLNVTMHDHTADKNKTVTIERKIEPDILPLLHKKFKSDPKNMIDDASKNIQPKNDNNKENKVRFDEKQFDIKSHKNIFKHEDNGDRYLTEKEINSIANVLHTVKKSDLDAIVDIYNLAQDIYKEMDKVTDEELVDEALNLIKEEDKDIKPISNPTSYWYHPFGNKGKMPDRYDMDNQGTNHVHSTAKPKTIVPNYFSGPLTRNDFGKLPYYYPISEFQRMSSYTHQPSQTTRMQKVNDVKTNKKPCKSKINQYKQREPESQKLIQPSFLLPYPFASIHNNYNVTEYPSSLYFKLNPWAINYYNKYKYYQPYYNAYIGPIPKAVLVNPHLTNEVQDEEQKPVNHIEINRFNKFIAKRNDISSWKTAPISDEDLKDIRANIDTTKLIKPFPLRRKIKLDRVGKLIKIDDVDNSKRLKRSCEERNDTDKEMVTDDFEKYEPYLEKITCQTETDPGYFRMGNLTHPYPDCCPKKIETR